MYWRATEGFRSYRLRPALLPYSFQLLLPALRRLPLLLPYSFQLLLLTLLGAAALRTTRVTIDGFAWLPALRACMTRMAREFG
jgi:hypothetical protein